LFLALGFHSGTGDDELAAASGQLDRLSQIGSDAVERGDDLQLLSGCGIRLEMGSGLQRGLGRPSLGDQRRGRGGKHWLAGISVISTHSRSPNWNVSLTGERS